ncbi:cellulase [Streptomyces sp. NPDC005774]|uniref:cellulase n=1 Tax=Streptomyces sp. NPDC005774 TaxID=3364728 RepID=UPI0036A5D03E
MDDFERELTHMMRDPRQQTPFDSERQKRLYQGIRARHRSRTLWRAGGSALAVAGLSAGLALLPGLGSGSQPPADHRPLPATSPTPPPVLPTPTPPATSSAPSTSRPPITTSPATDAPESGTPTATSPTATTSGSERTSAPPSPPVTTAPASPPPTSEPSHSPSFSAGLESAGSG